jgi:hypothetical protein
LRKSFITLLLTVAAAHVAWCSAPPAADRDDGREILERYFTVFQAQGPQMRGVQMAVDIEASLPKLKKEGRMQALRMVSRVGQIAYKGVRFVGDNTVKKDVIGRYLTAETQPTTLNIGINDENYKFKYKGLSDQSGRKVHVFQLNPRRKAVGLFKGELWIDPETHLPVRESGQFVKNPSVFLKKMAFVRQYEMWDGLAVPMHVESMVDTRVVGKAMLAIHYSHFEHAGEEPAAVEVGGLDQPSPR